MTLKLGLTPVDANFSLTDHIYERLKDAITSVNIYEPGANLRLDERKIAGELGISRTPVREALARLEQQGFITIQPRRGVFIKRKTLEDVLEMITVWAALESMAARLACARASDAELAALRAMAVAFDPDEAGARIAEYSEANIQFHRRILALSNCAMLRDIADGLFLHMRAVRARAMAESNRARRSVADHMTIIEALEARNAAFAGDLVREHTMRLHKHIEQSWSEFAGADAHGAAQAIKT